MSYIYAKRAFEMETLNVPYSVTIDGYQTSLDHGSIARIVRQNHAVNVSARRGVDPPAELAERPPWAQDVYLEISLSDGPPEPGYQPLQVRQVEPFDTTGYRAIGPAPQRAEFGAKLIVFSILAFFLGGAFVETTFLSAPITALYLLGCIGLGIYGISLQQSAKASARQTAETAGSPSR